MLSRILGTAALATLLLVSLAGADELRAQVYWDSPLMVAPATPAGWGVYLTDPSPGGGLGVLSTWRADTAPGGPGFRLGIAEDRRDRVTVFGGIDMSGSLVQASGDFPVNMIWVAGAGIGVGDGTVLSLPLGVSLGRDFESDGVWFNPYVGPRVNLDAWFGSDRSDSLRLRLAVDLGIDISFDPGWAVRFGGTLGDRNALAIGVSFRVR
ncbi:MAG: hypothetical protein EA352_08480 [Gemmatimonadales bacterium]|nr:MAG: hypothetical protein EA352_08480 [Gemmatimonadales bacterium]